MNHFVALRCLTLDPLRDRQLHLFLAGITPNRLQCLPITCCPSKIPPTTNDLTLEVLSPIRQLIADTCDYDEDTLTHTPSIY